jgi:hypothetical protein
LLQDTEALPQPIEAELQPTEALLEADEAQQHLGAQLIDVLAGREIDVRRHGHLFHRGRGPLVELLT